MRTTIDAGGRVVIPKAFRDELGFKPGSEVEIALADGRVEVEPVPTEMRLEQRNGHWVAVTDREMPVLTVEQVRETLERIRR